MIDGTIIDVIPDTLSGRHPGMATGYIVVYVTRAGKRMQRKVSQGQLDVIVADRGGKNGQSETRNAYIARIKSMTTTKRTGSITDFIAHGPIRDEESTLSEDGKTVVIPENHVAATIPARHDRGLLFQAPWETYADGFCEHSRRLARSLAMAGVPVHLRSVLPRHRNPVGEDRLVDQQYADLLHASIATYVGQVQMAVPSPGLLTRLVTSRYYTPDQVKYINARRVLSTVWERQSGLAADDRAALSVAGQLWVACPASKEFLIEEGLDHDKIRVVPCPYLPDDPHLGLFGRERRAGPTRFYHIGKWEPRKEQRRIILAFLLAFRPGHAMLLLKTSPQAPRFKDYPLSPMAAIQEALTEPRVIQNGWTADNVTQDVIIIARRLTGQQMIDLHRVGDVYVSLSRGEGYDMPAFDSKLSGNLLVYTPSGGPQWFAGEHDLMVEQTGTVPCHPWYNWPKDAEYLDYDIYDAAEALQAADDAIQSDGWNADRERRGWPKTMLDYFSAQATGERMRGYLEEIVDLDGKQEEQSA